MDRRKIKERKEYIIEKGRRGRENGLENVLGSVGETNEKRNETENRNG